VIDAIHKLTEKETAGDPISGVKWTRKTTGNIAGQLKLLGIAVSRNTVGRLLRQMKYCLRTNRKTISAGSTSDRDRHSRSCGIRSSLPRSMRPFCLSMTSPMSTRLLRSHKNNPLLRKPSARLLLEPPGDRY
jgi:hypothetical protein